MDMFSATLQLTEASITIRSDSLTVLAGLVARLREPSVIKPEDNPASGVGEAPVMTPAALVFGGGAAVPVPPPPPLAAPSTAVAAAIPIAPAAHISMEAARVGLPPAPPPVLSAPVPPAPVAPSIPAPGAVTVDKHGLPWDQRIHAGEKTKNKDGSWRIKRNTDKDLIAQVEAELRALMAIPVPPASAAPFVPPPPPSTASTAPAPAGSGANPAQPSAQPVASFGELMTYLTPLMTPPGKLTMEHMMSILAAQGIPALPMLMQRPDLITTVKDAVDQFVAGLS